MCTKSLNTFRSYVSLLLLYVFSLFLRTHIPKQHPTQPQKRNDHNANGTRLHPCCLPQIKYRDVNPRHQLPLLAVVGPPGLNVHEARVLLEQSLIPQMLAIKGTHSMIPLLGIARPEDDGPGDGHLPMRLRSGGQIAQMQGDGHVVHRRGPYRGFSIPHLAVSLHLE